MIIPKLQLIYKQSLSIVLWAAIIITPCTVQTVLAATELTVGVSTGYPPYYSKNNGIFSGFCIELLNRVAEKVGLTIHYQEFPWKRLLSNAKDGNLDAIMPLFRTKEREKYLYFDNLGIAKETNSFFIRENQEIPFDGTFDSLQKYTIGIITEYSYGLEFDNYKLFNKVVTMNEEHLLKMFKHDRFDIGVGNRSVINFYAKKLNIASEIRYLSPPITDDLLYIAFSKRKMKDSNYLKFTKALQEFKETDEYKQLVNKYAIHRIYSDNMEKQN